MSELCAGSCEVTLSEMCSFPPVESDAIFASFLKSKGVPLIGFIIPKPDPRYIYDRSTDVETGSVIIRWKPAVE